MFETIPVEHANLPEIMAIQAQVEATAEQERFEYDPQEMELKPYREAISHMLPVLDFINLDLPDREWLVEPLIHKGQIVMLFAKTGVGKTWFALALSLAISQGSKLFGPFRVPQPMGVVYVDGEMPASELRDRIKALQGGLEGCPFEILSSEWLSLKGVKTPNIADPNWRKVILEEMKARPDIRFLVLDNISALTPGLNEQERKDWDPVNQWLLDLRRLGLTVLFIHHAGKGGDQRGTSAREDQVDLILKLSKVEGRKIPTIKVEFEKARSLTADMKRPFMLEIVEDTGGRFVFQCKPISQDRLAQVASLLSRGHTQGEVAKRLGVGQGTVSKVARKARQEGLLEGGNLTAWGKVCCAGIDDD